MAPKAPAKGSAGANRAVRMAVNIWLWTAMESARDVSVKEGQDLNDNSKFIRLVNKEAERLVKSIRAGLREAVRELPGRAQKGEVDRIMRAAAPKIEKALKA